MGISAVQRHLRGAVAIAVASALAACGSAYGTSASDAGAGTDAAVSVVSNDEDATASRPEDAGADVGALPDATVDADAGTRVLFIAVPARRTDFGSVVDADAFCLTNRPPGVGNAKAILVGGSRRACTTANCGTGIAEHKDWPLAPSTVYTRADRSTIVGTTNGLGLFDKLEQSIGTDNSVVAWTGLRSNDSNTWTNWTTGDTCSSWSVMTGTTASGPYGMAGYTGPGYANAAFGSFEDGCARNYVLYCAETPAP